jgi:hypothetical protein
MDKSFVRLDKQIPLAKFLDNKMQKVRYQTEMVGGEEMVSAVFAEKDIKSGILNGCKFVIVETIANVDGSTTYLQHTELYSNIADIETKTKNYLIKEVVFI